VYVVVVGIGVAVFSVRVVVVCVDFYDIVAFAVIMFGVRVAVVVFSIFVVIVVVVVVVDAVCMFDGVALVVAATDV